MLLSNDEIQLTLTSAVNALQSEITTLTTLGSRELEVLKLKVILYPLLSLQLYSESSNGIPSLRGLGLEEGYILAKEVLSEEITARSFAIHRRKLLGGITPRG